MRYCASGFQCGTGSNSWSNRRTHGSPPTPTRPTSAPPPPLPRRLTPHPPTAAQACYDARVGAGSCHLPPSRPGSPRGPGDAFPTAPPTSQREHVGGASRPAPRPCYTVLAELGVLIPGGRRGRGNSKHSRSGCFRPRPRRYSVSTSGALRVRPPTPRPDRRSAPADALARPPPSPHPSRTTPTRPHRATRDAAPATTASRCTDSSASAS